MLRKVIIYNLWSFKEETVIDIAATGYKVLSESNVYNDSLKGLLFVGANASGKTNAIRALRLLLELLFAEKKINLALQKCLFSELNSFRLTYEFQISEDIITYFIEYNVSKKVCIERLIINNHTVLNRVGSSGESEITENNVYTDIQEESLLLREIYFNTKFRNHNTLKKWFDFLMHSIYLDGYKEYLFSPGNYSLNLEDYLEKKGEIEINRFFEQFNFNQRIEYSNSSNGNITRIESSLEKSIFFKREGVGEPIPFPLESLGNQKLLRLLPAFFHVVKHGGMLIVDEFSSGLHNFLEELLVRYFMENSLNAQLFLVSHSTNLLSNSLLRPDQIYAVDFTGLQGSTIKRFSSEQPRVAQNLEKMYTSGVFGGVPHYRDENNNIK
ncbi:AAA family ATPase [Paenibacillus kribbensis]|uniref:ATPase n=1 Tax=Paenibacillus kribbensis TaxID=172713 RepID=A0A222WR95_9BACL|nr:ATP-binding protein [Paenibacillus kribbensis]ASR49099.1 ATPase [Paenibacillus kribbensis]